jgi:hypothetical protein
VLEADCRLGLGSAVHALNSRAFLEQADWKTLAKRLRSAAGLADEMHVRYGRRRR